MICLKNFMVKWILIFILSTGIATVPYLSKVSASLSTRSFYPNVNFYLLPSVISRPGKNSDEENSNAWNDEMNLAEENSNFDDSFPEDSQPCDPAYPYRTMNGSCNNLVHSTWGTAYECYMRYQPASYKGSDRLQSSTDINPMPPARDISLNIFKDVDRPSQKVSFMFTIYGQTVALDLSRLDIREKHSKCCSPEAVKDPFCIDIPIKPTDPFYSQFKKTCLVMPAADSCISCNTTDRREQGNAGTAALDASNVYGTNDSLLMDIRAQDGTGKLLPTDKVAYINFCSREGNSPCFSPGDRRVNQHAFLSAMTTYYVKEHNRIATKLKKLNPHWNEEKLFQEARRVTVATLQCITYKEYLPILLGQDIMDQSNLKIRNGPDGSKYNPNVRLGVTNEFATAGFRLHSMIPKKVGAMNLRFRSFYLNPEIVQTDIMEKVMQGACKAPSQQLDHYYVEDVTNYFAKRPANSYGSDLSSIDIQRGRDHGLTPYIVMISYCSDGRVTISDFDDLAPLLMTQENAELLKKNYEKVEDIDLYVGMQMENHFPDSEVGPTATCIIAKQFYTAKFGDRFFFEHEGEVPSFNKAQRNSLKQCSLSRLLCDNSNITHVQKNAMLLPSESNPAVSCIEIPGIDLSPWAER